MSIFSIRINPKIKEQMDKLDIDWAEYIRKTIEQKIIEEKRKHAHKLWVQSENGPNAETLMRPVQ